MEDTFSLLIMRIRKVTIDNITDIKNSWKDFVVFAIDLENVGVLCKRCHE